MFAHMSVGWFVGLSTRFLKNYWTDLEDGSQPRIDTVFGADLHKAMDTFYLYSVKSQPKLSHHALQYEQVSTMLYWHFKY